MGNNGGKEKKNVCDTILIIMIIAALLEFGYILNLVFYKLFLIFTSLLNKDTNLYIILTVIFFFNFMAAPIYMEVPRPGVESELQLQPAL